MTFSLDGGRRPFGHRTGPHGLLGPGQRIDPFLSLELGMRTTYASGRIAPVENQTVGRARIGIGHSLKLVDHNDHRFRWFPMGDGATRAAPPTAPASTSDSHPAFPTGTRR